MTQPLPNIIFLMPDQLRWDFVGAYRQGNAKTPHIDRLAARGMLFDRCYSPSPVCIPARASLLTGHNALATGVLSNNYWLRPDHDVCGMPSFATLLGAAGYHTEAIGKMHFIPWDICEGFAHRLIAEDKRHIHIRDDYQAYLHRHGFEKFPGLAEPGYFKGRMASISLLPLQHQVDKWVGDRCVEFLSDFQEERPFFLWAAFPGPHDPYNPPAELLVDVARPMQKAFPGTAATKVFRPAMIETTAKGSAGVDIAQFPVSVKVRIRQHYSALINLIDQQVGAIVAALEARDDGRETLIIFASDHGDFLGDFDFLGKALFFESAMRVPMIVAGANTPVGRSGALVSLSDVFATVTMAAGLRPRCQDSQILPSIGYDVEPRNYLMGATDKGYMITDGRWKLSRYRNGVSTLHDVVTDPAEQWNRWSDVSEQARREALDCVLQDWILASVMDGHSDKRYPYMTMNPEHSGHRRGWQRRYPANPWDEEFENGLT